MTAAVDPTTPPPAALARFARSKPLTGTSTRRAISQPTSIEIVDPHKAASSIHSDQAYCSAQRTTPRCGSTPAVRGDGADIGSKHAPWQHVSICCNSGADSYGVAAGDPRLPLVGQTVAGAQRRDVLVSLRQRQLTWCLSPHATAAEERDVHQSADRPRHDCGNNASGHSAGMVHTACVEPGSGMLPAHLP